jgi:hypothetical protein
MPASSPWGELEASLARVGSWIEAANGSNHDRVELLHDHGPPVRSFHDPLELGELVTGGQQEVRPGPSIDCQFSNGEGVKSVAPQCGLKR